MIVCMQLRTSIPIDVTHNVWYAVFAASGVVLSAVYMLWMYQRVIFGKLTNPDNQKLKDLNKREIGILIPIILFIVWIGVYPSTFLNKSDKSVKVVIDRMEYFKNIKINSTHSLTKISTNLNTK